MKRQEKRTVASAGRRESILIALATALLLCASFLPSWLLFPLAIALANGIAAAGVVVLMKTGNVTFGQSLPFCVGAYCAWLVPSALGITDALLIVLCAGSIAMLLAAIIGVFLVRFGGIFFAMLSLAFSMMFYGFLVKSQSLGGSDGLSVAAPTLATMRFEGESILVAGYLITVLAVALAMFATRRLQRSWIGLGMNASGGNDIRVIYLGGNVRLINWIAFCYAGLLGGVGGALIAILSGHASPEFAYWAKSGELVLVAVLGNSVNVLMVFIASILIEMIRMFAATSFPYTWQAVLGVTLLAIILFLPGGLDTLMRRIARRSRSGDGGSVDVRP